MLRLSTASGSKRRVGNPENAGTFLNTPNEKLYSVYSDIAKLTPLLFYFHPRREKCGPIAHIRQALRR